MPISTIEKPLPVSITARAASEIKQIMANKNIPAEYALRVGIRGGGCSGLSYLLGFDKAKETDDSYTHPDGFGILIEKKHAMYVLGMQIDFEDGVNARGFIFSNPDVPQS